MRQTLRSRRAAETQAVPQGGRHAALGYPKMRNPRDTISVHGPDSRWSRLRQRRQGATIVLMTVEPLRDVRNHFSDVIDRVEHEHERVTVTRNGRPVAVILSPEDLAELEETLAVLSDPQALADIREADAAYAAGDVVRGVDAVRALRS
jgi:antitoxin YefM